MPVPAVLLLRRRPLVLLDGMLEEEEGMGDGEGDIAMLEGVRVRGEQSNEHVVKEKGMGGVWVSEVRAGGQGGEGDNLGL